MVEGGILYKGVCDVYVVCSPPPSGAGKEDVRGSQGTFAGGGLALDYAIHLPLLRGGVGDRAGCGRGEYAMYTILIVPLVVREAGGLSKLSFSDRIQLHGLTWVPTKEHRMFKLQ